MSMRKNVPSLSSIDFEATPFVAIWEVTRACDLACRHCRAEAIPEALPGELTTEEGKALLQDLAEMGTPICVLSGGDPAKRVDLLELIRFGSEQGMRMATIPAATSRLTRQFVAELKGAGLSQMALSLDGPNPEVHDSFRRVPGAFEKTIEGAGFARDVGIPLQINTTLSAYNRDYFEEMAELVGRLGVVFWEVFFLVPMGRGRELGQLTAGEFEALFARLSDIAESVDYIIKVTEAPHYRRFLMQRHARSPLREEIQSTSQGPNGHGRGNPGHGKGRIPHHMRRDFGPGGSIGLAPKGVNSGQGHLFVSYCGDISPSGFLPLTCGNLRRQSVKDVYRFHPVFRELRNADLLKGKCGVCEFRHICAGSRARAFAMTGDYLAEEPFCAYTPMQPPRQRPISPLAG